MKLAVGYLALWSLCRGSDLPAASDELFLQKLKNCNICASKFGRPEGAVALQMCKKTYLYSVLGGDIAEPPPGFGSSVFLQALLCSKVPERLIEMAEEDVHDEVTEARRAWGCTRLYHQERCREIDPVSEIIDSEQFADTYHSDNPYFAYSLQQAQRFRQSIKIIGDGNCFYRAFLVGLISYFQKKMPNGPSFETRLTTLDALDALIVVEDQHEVMESGMRLLKMCLENALYFPLEYWRKIVLNRYRASDAMIYALRGIVASYASSPSHQGFIVGRAKDFIRDVVLTMGEWGGQFEMACLTDFFNVSLTVTDLPGQKRIPSSDTMNPEDIADIEVIYNGAHYDMYHLG